MNAPRSDSWYAGLTEEQLWAMYSTAKKFGSAWYKTIEWANAKWKLELKTSKTAYYRWKEWMYDQDSGTREHFAALTSRSVEEQAAAARILDRSLTDGIKSLAAQALFVADDPIKGKTLAETFSKFATAALEGEKLKLAAAAQSTKDEQLKLAREKFEAAEKRLERVAEIADAARGGKVDPAKVADEIDRILGRKK